MTDARIASNLPTANNRNSNNKIIFWDFKDYWKDALRHIITKFPRNIQEAIKINKWDNEEYAIYSNDINNTGELIQDKYDPATLHIFIAPITWAGLYTDHFKIIGPAFGTYGDIKLYNLKDKTKLHSKTLKKNEKQKITIGVIDELATSTYGLHIILRGICKQIGNSNILNNPTTEIDWANRLIKLKSNNYSAVVFNENDVKYLDTHGGIKEVNDIVDIDELYSLAKNITNLPRVVYAISNTQHTAFHLTEIRNILYNTLKSIDINLPNIINGKIHILAPFNQINRKSIIDFIEDGEKAFCSGSSKDKKTRNSNNKHQILDSNFLPI